MVGALCRSSFNVGKRSINACRAPAGQLPMSFHNSPLPALTELFSEQLAPSFLYSRPKASATGTLYGIVGARNAGRSYRMRVAFGQKKNLKINTNTTTNNNYSAFCTTPPGWSDSTQAARPVNMARCHDARAKEGLKPAYCVLQAASMQQRWWEEPMEPDGAKWVEGGDSRVACACKV